MPGVYINWCINTNGGGRQLSGEGGSDCMVARLHSDESLTWAYALGTTEEESCPALTLDDEESQVYIGGWTGSDVDFTESGWDHQHILSGELDGWVLPTSTEGP